MKQRVVRKQFHLGQSPVAPVAGRLHIPKCYRLLWTRRFGPDSRFGHCLVWGPGWMAGNGPDSPTLVRRSKLARCCECKFRTVKEVAIHTGPEPCAVVCEDGGEALTGVRVGRVLSCERERIHRGADALRVSGRLHPDRRYRETSRDPARSETPCMHASTSFRNREIPRPPAEERAAGRIGKSKDARR